LRRLRALVANLALAAGALAFAVLLCEGALRQFPRLLPKGTYGASHYRADLLSSVYDDVVIYNKVRFVVREPNSEGFLDLEHAREKPRGVARVGIFGDSYVESAQVPLEQAFYRLAARSVGPERIEVLGFGMSGWGTLHSFLAYEALASKYDLDAAVYVFVENDLGDNALEVQGQRSLRLSPKVFATLSPLPPGYELVQRNPPGSLGLPLRAAKWFQENWLLGRLVHSRISLLRRAGVRLRIDPAAQQMATRASGVPDQNDLPSSWPASYAARARTLGQRILRHWRDRAGADGRTLFVLYVPRGEDALRDASAAADSWRPWLEATTRELGLPLIDPGPALRRRLESGTAVYDDHWSPAGHEVVAEVLATHLAGWLDDGGRRGR
jgi:hypothetical protein